eukprot:15029268-Alexandrium_andersonii.AAC.1
MRKRMWLAGAWEIFAALVARFCSSKSAMAGARGKSPRKGVGRAHATWPVDHRRKGVVEGGQG